MVRQQVAYSKELEDMMARGLATKSQRQVAREAQVSQGTIGNMTMGRVPSREVVAAVAPAIDVSIPAMLEACGYEVQPLPDAIISAAKQSEPDLTEAEIAQLWDLAEKIAEEHENINSR
jgi:transcriptional regulator with XRE-family HTH domain